MGLKDFAVLVEAMRANQRLYFQTKSPTVLGVCKTQEREVDAAVAAILGKRENINFDELPF